MLRQVMLTKKIEQKRAALEKIAEERAALQEREAELESAADQAKTDEEIETVSGEADKLEGEMEQNAQNKTNLESEIAELEGELEGLNSKTPAKNERSRTESKNRNDGKGETRMKRYGILGAMRADERNAFLEREDVQEFLTRVREFKGEKRAVSGAELSVPDVMLELIRDNLYKYSKLISKVRLRSLSGKARQNILGKIPEAIWTEAVGKINELDFGLNQVEVDGYKVAGFVPIPNSTMEDSDLALASEIIEVLGQAIGLGVDKAIIYGTGIKMPLGFLTRIAQTAKPSDWEKNAPEWTDLHTSNVLKIDPTGKTPEEFFSELVLDLGKVRANYATGGTWWAMNRATRMQLMAKALTFNASGAIVAGATNTIPVEGGEIIELGFMPDGDIAGGYGDLYLLVERAGAKLAQSEHVRFLEDQTVFKGTARYDGLPVFGESFVVVNINNTAPKTTIEFAPDKANTVNP